MKTTPATATLAANAAEPATRHRLHEDLQALVTGTLFVALGGSGSGAGRSNRNLAKPSG